MQKPKPKKFKTKITIFGAGYVGFSLAVLLAKKNEVNLVDIDDLKVDLINKGNSPVKDSLITSDGVLENIQINAYKAFEDSLVNSDYFIIAIPSNFDEKMNSFDTTSIDHIANSIIEKNKDATIIIKSTIPIGHTDFLKKKLLTEKIIFLPEFLREGSAYSDQLNPSRIIVGGKVEFCEQFIKLLLGCIEFKKTPILYMSDSEAEAVKLFSNSYLALRVSFFNELDSFALEKQMNSKAIIDGLSLDSRIGNEYNNPSFGYGGYCLPKDTKQLLAQYENVPQSIFSAVIDSNSSRKSYIISKIEERSPLSIGVFRLQMKKNSDNYRESAILDIMNELKNKNYKIILYEPIYIKESMDGINICNDLEKFKSDSDIILANRIDECLDDVAKKVFSRDIFRAN
jgi:UDPglucose 6-dehydrogenase